MPVADTVIKESWADQAEDNDSDGLPAMEEVFNKEKGIKSITEYKINDEGKKVKIVRTYKIETRRVSKSIAKRKTWAKYGAAAKDPPGPNPSNTIISEDVIMQFIHSKEQQLEQEDDPLTKLKAGAAQKLVSCRICKGDHWTTKCPFKDTLEPINESAPVEKESLDKSTLSKGSSTGKYVPPNQREGATTSRGESMSNSRRDEAATIRVTNLSEDTRESDLQELFKPFGNISRIYLAKDKITGQSKGFAFINFYHRDDAARAIEAVSGFGYDHLILNVEWAKPSGDGKS